MLAANSRRVRPWATNTGSSRLTRYTPYPRANQRATDTAGSQTLRSRSTRRSSANVSATTAAANTAQQSSRKGRWVVNRRRAMAHRSSARSLIVLLPTAG
jgi:hypothetical protein